MNSEESRGFYFSTEEGCIDKASMPQHLYSNVLLTLINRMLKLTLQIYRHRLIVDQELVNIFNEIAEQKLKFTKGFSLTKKRIGLIEREMMKVQMEQDFKSQILSQPNPH